MSFFFQIEMHLTQKAQTKAETGKKKELTLTN